MGKIRCQTRISHRQGKVNIPKWIEEIDTRNLLMRVSIDRIIIQLTALMQ